MFNELFNLENGDDKISALLQKELPEEIDGFTRRISIVNENIIIQYSKKGNYLLKKENVDETDFNETVLYEVVGNINNLNDLILEMKNKIEINQEIQKDFLKYIVVDYKPNFIFQDLMYRIFELYIVVDENSNSQFLAIATTNIERDLGLILSLINTLKKIIKKGNINYLRNSKMNVAELSPLRVIHLYSKDFNRKKDKIRAIFKRHNWTVKFKDKYFFEKRNQENINKALEEIIILCEGKNVSLLNSLNIKGVLFSDELNSYTIFQNVKTRHRFALRDKDYLTIKEKKALETKFKNYYILDYYSLENYLYHPDNIEQLNIPDFDKKEYIMDITRQKNENLTEIIQKIPTIRKGYKELSENHIKINKNN